MLRLAGECSKMFAASVTNSRPAPQRSLAHGANASPDEASGHWPANVAAAVGSGPALELDHSNRPAMPGDGSSVAGC